MLSKKQTAPVSEPELVPASEIEAQSVVKLEPRFVMSFQQYCQETHLSLSLVGAMKSFVRGDMRDRTAEEWKSLYARLETV